MDVPQQQVIEYCAKCKVELSARAFVDYRFDRGELYCAACIGMPSVTEAVTFTPAVLPENGKFRPVVFRSDDPEHMFIYDLLLSTEDEALQVAQGECRGIGERANAAMNDAWQGDTTALVECVE